MANEIRKRSNFLSGTITNNPLAAGGTTLNAAALADLEVISSTEHALVILDPLGEGNGPDLAYITAHTSAATSATIARSKEGTTGVEHATGTKFLIGPVESDFVMAKPGAELPSTPYYAGQLVVDTDGPTLKMGKADLSGWYAIHPLVPQTVAGVGTPSTLRSTSSTSYVDWPVTDTCSATITKYRADTKLVIHANGSGYISAGAASVSLAVQVNGVDYPVAEHYIGSLNLNIGWSGVTSVSGLAAGSYTVKVRAKVSANTFNTDSLVTVSITETM